MQSMINMEKITIWLSIWMVFGLLTMWFYIGSYSNRLSNVEVKVLEIGTDIKSIQFDVNSIKISVASLTQETKKKSE